MILTNNGKKPHQLSQPMKRFSGVYWAQAEEALEHKGFETFRRGVKLRGGCARPAIAMLVQPPDIWQCTSPIKQRASRPISWIGLTDKEAKNHQPRRVTVSHGHPTRRHTISHW